MARPRRCLSMRRVFYFPVLMHAEIALRLLVFADEVVAVAAQQKIVADRHQATD